jgi:hypothetical protein
MPEVIAIYPLDIAIIIWGAIGNYRLKRLLQLLANRKCSHSTVIFTALAFILFPLLIIRANVAEYSAVGIVVVCVEIFWFAILASRSGSISR